MPDGGAVGIGDLAVIYRAGNTVRVLNIFRSVQVIHRTVQPGVSMGLTVGHSIAIGITASDIAHGIQVHFTEGDFAQRTVILHDPGNRGHGVRIFVGCGSRVIGVVGTTCVLILDFIGRLLAGLVDGHGGLHTARSQQLGASRITGGDVGTVMGIVQRDHAAVVGFGDFDVIPPLAQGCTFGSGMLHIRPIAVVTGRCTSFDDDELSLVPLGIIHLPAGIVFGSIVSTVGHRVGTILIANNTIFVVVSIGDVLLRNGVPFVDLIQCVPGDLLTGLAVHLFQIDLQAPLVIFHNVVVGTIGRHGDGLVAAKTAIEFLEAIRDLHFIVREADGCQFSTGGCNSCIYHALCFVLQLGNGSVFGCFCRRIRFGLAAVGAFLAAKRGSGSLGDLVMHRPSYCAIAAIVLVFVIVGMAGGGNGLRTGRAHQPAAAVDAAAGFGGRNGNGCPVNLFCGFQLLLIGIDCKSQVKTTAGALSRSDPAGGVILGIGDVGNIGTAFLIGNFRTDQSNNLPCISGRRAINVGVIALARGKRTNSIICPQKLCSRRQIGFCSSTFRVIFDDP